MHTHLNHKELEKDIDEFAGGGMDEDIDEFCSG